MKPSPLAVQPDLFVRRDYRSGTSAGAAVASDTSVEAAAHVTPTLGARQQRVLDVLVRLRSATGEEIADVLGIPTYQVLPRLTELSLPAVARVRDSGKRRMNRTGRRATVWTVAR